MSYSTGSHTIFYHRYHIVWITKYRYKVLQGKLRERVRDIIRQVCREMGVQIIEGVLSSDHIHMFGRGSTSCNSKVLAAPLPRPDDLAVGSAGRAFGWRPVQPLGVPRKTCRWASEAQGMHLVQRLVA